MNAIRIGGLCLVLPLLVAGADPKPKPALTDDDRTVMQRISAGDLMGRLSFLASDLLEGRDTPSRGLDLAAEYIASEFRRAGLEPGGNDGYFQTADFELLTPVKDGFSLKVTGEAGEAEAGPDEAAFTVPHAMDLAGMPVTKLDVSSEAAVKKLKPEDLAGHVVVMQAPRAGLGGLNAAFQLIGEGQPPLLVFVGGGGMRLAMSERLVDPAAPTGHMGLPPMVRVVSPAFTKLFDALPVGNAKATATVHIAEPIAKPVKLRNVVGILRGSDRALKKTCVMVTAHYDHVGMKASGTGDRIYNGANDDGSGTDSVMELAKALAGLKPHPLRSIVFVAFFGEEKGGLGSAYYGRHPVFPVSRTVADINLEQIGRTDSTEGPQVGTATLTGFGYSTVSEVLVRAGRLTGVNVYKDPKNSDAYFSRSDNQSMADVGVPAHTLCVAFDYPDYHGVGDEWPKIDYKNMARVDRMVAVALLTMADSATEPRWNPKEPKAAQYLRAWEKSHAAAGN